MWPGGVARDVVGGLFLGSHIRSRILQIESDCGKKYHFMLFGVYARIILAFCIAAFHSALEWTSQGFCCHGLSVVHSTSHHTTTSHHITCPHNQPHNITTSITTHPIASLHIRSHCMTAQRITLHHVTLQHITSHRITSHRITSHPVTSRHIRRHDTTSHLR